MRTQDFENHLPPEFEDTLTQTQIDQLKIYLAEATQTLLSLNRLLEQMERELMKGQVIRVKESPEFGHAHGIPVCIWCQNDN